MLLISALIAAGVSELLLCKTQSQVAWESSDTSKVKQSPIDWEPVDKSEKRDKSRPTWKAISESEAQNLPSSGVVWEAIEEGEERFNPTPKSGSGSIITPASSLEEAEALLDIIPLNPSDYQPPLRLSPLVATAETLPVNQWRYAFRTISFFKNGTGNHNYLANLDIGLKDSLSVSLFTSKSHNKINALINGSTTQLENFWESYGAAARWQALNHKNLKIAISGSIEGWEVGSGSDSPGVAGEEDNPNIFNNSGRSVFTQNIIGSLSLPLSWQASDKWQLSFSPGVTFLPATQGSGQGGAGTFFGTNPYISGGILFQPFPELGLTATLAQPIGSGTNSFDADLIFSRVPIYSAGFNWDLNPRIGLTGLITNGFGTTPATALLALPSDNRLGYSASFIYTPDRADTPQIPLTLRQRSLAKGGLTVNTALVPPETHIETWVNTDSGGNFNTYLGYSLSNVFQATVFSRGRYNNVPQTTPQSRLYTNDGFWNWQISGKAVALSPLRGAAFWGGGRVSLGRSSDDINNTSQGYLLTETMATWEATERMAISINPKLAWSGVENKWGLGISSNIQLFPSWELIAEANLIANQLSQSNSTIGLRWHVTDNVAIETYGSTAASLLDIGQFINAKEVRWGGRLLISF